MISYICVCVCCLFLAFRASEDKKKRDFCSNGMDGLLGLQLDSWQFIRQKLGHQSVDDLTSGTEILHGSHVFEKTGHPQISQMTWWQVKPHRKGKVFLPGAWPQKRLLRAPRHPVEFWRRHAMRNWSPSSFVDQFMNTSWKWFYCLHHITFMLFKFMFNQHHHHHHHHQHHHHHHHQHHHHHHHFSFVSGMWPMWSFPPRFLVRSGANFAKAFIFSHLSLCGRVSIFDPEPWVKSRLWT